MSNDIQVSDEDRKLLDSAKVEWLGRMACKGTMYPGDNNADPRVSSWLLYDLRESYNGFLELIGKDEGRETVLWRDSLSLGMQAALNNLSLRVFRRESDDSEYPPCRVRKTPYGLWYLEVPLCTDFTEEEVLGALYKEARWLASSIVENLTEAADHWKRYL